MTRPELGSPGVSYRDLGRFESNFGYEGLGASSPKGPGWVKPLLDYPSRHVQIHVANNVGSGQGASLSISRSMNGQSTLHMISSLSDCASPASLTLPDFAERSTGTRQWSDWTSTSTSQTHVLYYIDRRHSGSVRASCKRVRNIYHSEHWNHQVKPSTFIVAIIRLNFADVKLAGVDVGIAARCHAVAGGCRPI